MADHSDQAPKHAGENPFLKRAIDGVAQGGSGRHRSGWSQPRRGRYNHAPAAPEVEPGTIPHEIRTSDGGTS